MVRLIDIEHVDMIVPAQRVAVGRLRIIANKTWTVSDKNGCRGGAPRTSIEPNGCRRLIGTFPGFEIPKESILRLTASQQYGKICTYIFEG